MGNLLFAAELLAYGAVVETYEKGFMHAKTMIVDSGVVSIGSANIDVRSFRLDFEVNTVVYDAKVAEEARQAFLLTQGFRGIDFGKIPESPIVDQGQRGISTTCFAASIETI